MSIIDTQPEPHIYDMLGLMEHEQSAKQMAEAVFGQLSGLMQCHICREWFTEVWTRATDPKAADTLACGRCFSCHFNSALNDPKY